MDWTGPVLTAAFVGSLLGVLIRRLPAGRPVGLARSACEQCGAPIAAYDMVPLLSYLMLRGRCRACGGKIAAQHWHVELAAVMVAASAALFGPGSEAGPAQLWVNCGLGWTLLTLAWIDWEGMWLPDVLTLPLIPAGLFATLWLDPDQATEHAIAAALAYAVFRALAWTYRLARGREGLGQGDAKLLAALAAWTGLKGLPMVVLGAALVGLAAAGVLTLQGRTVRGTTAIPFGPCLALAGWIVRLHGG